MENMQNRKNDFTYILATLNEMKIFISLFITVVSILSAYSQGDSTLVFF